MFPDPSAVTPAFVHQNGRLLLTAGDAFFWCTFAAPSTDCQKTAEWQRGQAMAEQLSLMPVTAGVLGVSATGALLYAAFADGGISMHHCDKRCWDADNWLGGFSARGAAYGAKAPPSGSFGSFDPTSGAVTLAYPVLGAGDMPDQPKKLLFIDGATLDVKRAP